MAGAVRLEGNEGADFIEMAEPRPGTEEVPVTVGHCCAEVFHGSVPLMVLSAVLHEVLVLMPPEELAEMLPWEPELSARLVGKIRRVKREDKNPGVEDWSDLDRTREG